MTATGLVDVAGGPMGGAARFRAELHGYLTRTGRRDITIIGANRRLTSAWLVHRELALPTKSRKVSLNNVGFVGPGGERWTLLGNALHFLNEAEISRLHPTLQVVARKQAKVVRLAATRSDVLIAPCSEMAQRIATVTPSLRDKITVRMHPVSANFASRDSAEPLILCPVVFEKYKHMTERIAEWVSAVDDYLDPDVRMLVTANLAEVPGALARHRRIQLVGRLQHADLCKLWARSRAIYFPTGLESFGFPLAEARVNGQPVIALDTEQNREIAGPALCGFDAASRDSLLHATDLALKGRISPDPGPFDPQAYFEWMLGPQA